MVDASPPTRGIRLGRIGSARVIVQPSTLVMLVILALFFASNDEGGITSRAFSMGMLLAVLLFLSIFVHELAHAIAAWGFKRRVNEIVLTLWGGHTSFDARGITPLVSGVTAIAGPIANALIAITTQLVISADIVQGTPRAVLGWLVWANILLALFNALPGIPMDGGRVLESIIWSASGNRSRATIVAAWSGRVIAIVVLVGSLAWPLLQGRSPGLTEVLFAVLIFSVLWPAASTALRVTQLIDRRERVSAGTLMVPAVPQPYTATVADARAAAAATGAREVVVLATDGSPAGHFPVSLTTQVPAELHATTGLQSVTMPLPRGAVIEAWLQGEELVAALRTWHDRTDAWAVVDNNGVVGVLTLDAALKALQ